MTKLEREHSKFDEARNEYRGWAEEELTANQRIVSVRIDASYTLRNWVKTVDKKDRAECYRAYLRLVDAWFTYEALVTWAAEEDAATSSGAKPDKLLKSQFPTSMMSDVVTDFHKDMTPVLEKPNRSASLLAYVDTLSNYPGTSRSQKSHLAALKGEVQQGTFSSDNYSRVLAFAYAIRNAYAHNGETAKSGTNHYGTKVMILNALYVFVLRIVLRASAQIYNTLSEEIS